MRTVLADIRSMVMDRGHGKFVYFVSAVLKVLLYPRIQAVILFRLSNVLYRWKLFPLAYFLQAVQGVISGAEIHPAARIGPGLCIIHSQGIVIGDRARIGRNFQCFQGVTVGDSRKDGLQPVIGDRVVATAGCKILGGISIGDDAVIGANAVVLIDVPANGVAVGVPARVVSARRTNDMPVTVPHDAETGQNGHKH
jgi:serine O-acetyltransferase